MVINTLRSSRLNFLMLYYCTCVNFCIWHSSTRYSLWWKWPNRTAKILTLCILFTHSTVWPETRYWGHLITEVLPLMPNYTYQLGRVLISLDNLIIWSSNSSKPRGPPSRSGQTQPRTLVELSVKLYLFSIKTDYTAHTSTSKS